MENGRKLGPADERGAARPRRSKRAANLRGDGGEGDLEPLLVGHCRQAVTLLPRGVLGVTTAIEFLEALPGAHRLGLPDVTHSGPKLFALLVAHGVLAAMPSPRVVPAALGLVAGVSPLLEPRSARQWSLWLGQLREPGSPIVAALRRQTPRCQISLAPTTTAPPLRAAALRADRDRLAAELVRATEELARILNIPDDDPGTFTDLVVGLAGSWKEQTARADTAQQGLHRLLADLATAEGELAALREKNRDVQARLDAQEIELAAADAELCLRRSRLFRPDLAEVQEYRAAGAADARRAQQQRRSEGE